MKASSILLALLPLSVAAQVEIVLPPHDVSGAAAPLGREDYYESVATISRAEIDALAGKTWGDLLRRLPQSGAGALNAGRFGSLAPGAEAVALRGLRADATLVLLNGRRLPVYPFAEDGSTNFVDIGLLPGIAVREIGISSDQAGSVYGLDAVAGVVDFRLLDRFDGGRVGAVYAVSDGGAPRLEAGAMMGRQTERGGIVVALEVRDHEALGQGERGFSASNDQRARGGTDFRSSVSNPGSVFHPQTGARLVVPANSDGTPTAAELRPGNPRFDRAPYQMLAPAIRRTGAIALLHRELNERVEAFAELSHAEATTRFSLSPSPIQGDDQGLFVPASNPFNPFQAPVTFRYRATEAGARYQVIDTESRRATVGLRGDIGAWRAELAATLHDLRTSQLEANNLWRPAVVAAMANPDPARAFNVFGAGDAVNSPAVIAGMKLDALRSGRSRLSGIDAHASGPWVAARRTMETLAGVEFWREELTDRADPRVERNEVIDFKGSSASGARNTAAAFAQLAAPLRADEEVRSSTLVARVAGRFEQAEDFGGTFVPRLSLAWQPRPQLRFNASAGRSFRAPGLAQLYAAQTRQSRELRDTTRFRMTAAAADSSSAVLVRTGGEPGLRPEEANQFSLDAVWHPRDGWEFAAGAFQIAQTDVVAAMDAQSILDHESLYAGLVHRHPATAADAAAGLPGALISVDSSYRNLARQSVSGADFQVSFRRGACRAGLNGTWMARFVEQAEPTRPEVDLAGTYARPELRALATLHWEPRGWSFGVEIEHTGDFADAGGARRVAAATLANLSLARHLVSQHLTVRVRVDNIADRAPPFADNAQGYAPALHDPRGRVLSLAMQWQR